MRRYGARHHALSQELPNKFDIEMPELGHSTNVGLDPVRHIRGTLSDRGIDWNPYALEGQHKPAQGKAATRGAWRPSPWETNNAIVNYPEGVV